MVCILTAGLERINCGRITVIYELRMNSKEPLWIILRNYSWTWLEGLAKTTDNLGHTGLSV